MAKITVCKKSDFTVLDNGIFRDKRLSLKARGLLVTMLSLPEEWNYTIEGLTKILKEGKDSIRSALNELEECGYLVRNRIRNDKGQLLDTEYTLYEKSQKSQENKGFEPKSENPTLDNPTLEKPIQLNTKYIKNQINKNYSSTALKDRDFSNEIIAKMKSLTQDYCLIDCVINYLTMFRECRGYHHPDISIDCLINFINTVEYLFDGFYDEVNEDNGFAKIIDRHFNYKYKQDVDYKFQHFATRGIIEYHARYFGYIEGYSG